MQRRREATGKNKDMAWPARPSSFYGWWSSRTVNS